MAVELELGPLLAPKIELDCKLYEVIVDGKRSLLTRSQWDIFEVLWDAQGAFVSNTILSGKTGINALGLRYHVRLIRLKLGVQVILTHGKIGFGYRLNM